MKISTTGGPEIIGTVNFSVPEDVKQAFNEALEGRNKGAIIAGLMREAVDRAERKQRYNLAIARILKRRKNAQKVAAEDVRAAREDGDRDPGGGRQCCAEMVLERP